MYFSYAADAGDFLTMPLTSIFYFILCNDAMGYDPIMLQENVVSFTQATTNRARGVK